MNRLAVPFRSYSRPVPLVFPSRPVPLVFVVAPGRMARLHRQRRADIPGQLLAHFIQTDLRPERIVRSLVDFPNVLHRRHKLGVLLRWPSSRDLGPLLPQMRFEIVFLSVNRTVSGLIDSTTSKATKRSAQSVSVQRLRPSGAALHASAIRRASAAPSHLRDSRFVEGLRYTAASKPCSTNRCRTRWTVERLTSANSAARSSIHAGPSWDSSTFSSTRTVAAPFSRRDPHPPSPATRPALHPSTAPRTSHPWTSPLSLFRTGTAHNYQPRTTGQLRSDETLVVCQ